jgi:hypothetical protein
MASESSLTGGSNADLEGLSDLQATIHFPDSNDFARTLRASFDNAFNRDSLCDRTVLVTGFPIKSFIIDDDDVDDEELLIPRKSKALYLKESQILVVTMAGAPHEVASEHFERRLTLKLNAMNCLEGLISYGRAIREMENVSKEPDKSWGPRGSDYITCALEATVSESKRALQGDAKIWLEHPESHVTQVITIKICRARPEIVFSVWKTMQEETGTRAQHPPHAIIDHEVQVTLADGRPIAEGTLCLSFEKLFERRPGPGSAECDIVFSARELGGIARVVWEGMEFEM